MHGQGPCSIKRTKSIIKSGVLLVLWLFIPHYVGFSLGLCFCAYTLCAFLLSLRSLRGGLSQGLHEVWRLWEGVERPGVLERVQWQGNGPWDSGKCTCKWWWWCLYHCFSLLENGLCDSEVSQMDFILGFHLRKVGTFLMEGQWKRNSFSGAYYVLGLVQKLKYITSLNLTNHWKISITATLLLLLLLF